MKPRIFIGSSKESLNIANAVAKNLEYSAEPTVWTDGVFNPSEYSLESLLQSRKNFDGAIFIFSPDDVVEKRSEKEAAVRDNVIFECGLFIGHYGRKRCFILQPRNINFETPSDLIGLQPATYDPDRTDKNLNAALRPSCESIIKSLKKHISVDYPKEGDYGPNLLNKNIEEPLKSSSQETIHYSLAAKAPNNFPLMVRVSAETNDDNDSSGWFYSVGAVDGWVKSDLIGEMTREFRLPRGGRGDLDVNFKGSGTLTIEIFEKNENNLTDSLEFVWK